MIMFHFLSLLLIPSLIPDVFSCGQTSTQTIAHVLHVFSFSNHFIDLDYSSSDGDNGIDYPIDLFGAGIDQQEYIDDEFGLFYHVEDDEDDDDEDNLTLFGKKKMIIIIELRAEYTRFLIEYQSLDVSA